MAQRSINRKKRVRKQSVQPVQSPNKAEAGKQELRKKRAHRYQKKRAALKAARLKQRQTPESSSRKSVQSSAQTAVIRKSTVVGKSQRKRIRQQRTLRPLDPATTSAKARSRTRQLASTSRTYPPTNRPGGQVVRRSQAPRRQRPRKKSSSLQIMRLLTAGVGVAMISGFAITLMHPRPSGQSAQNSNRLQFQEPPLEGQVPVEPPAPSYEKPGKELRQLKQEIRNLVVGQPDLETGLFFLNPETYEFVSHRGSEVFPAASMIKLPVLIAFFQDVDSGKVQLEEELTMRPDLIAGEAGAMQYDQPGSQYDALHTADWMITISDNTATNMIIDRLGGFEVLNQRFQEWGLEHTKINQPLPDLEGTNTMSPKDLAVLMAKVSQGELLSAHSRDRALDILRHTVTKTLLPQGIESNAQIAHKTGDIGMAVGDAGLIDMPNGQRYVAGIVVKRPHNDPRAQELIRAISKLAYKVFSERPVPPTRPTPSSTGPSTQPQ